MENEDILYMWLLDKTGVGYKKTTRLIQELGNIYEVYKADEKILEKIVDKNTANIVSNDKNLDRIKKEYERLINRNIKILHPYSSQYPEKLRHIHNPPGLLYVKGVIKKQLNIYNNTVSVVGTRTPTVYGKEMASYFSKMLAGQNLCVISGLAKGVDSAAHHGAMEAQGYTIGVLGCGINITYPRENVELYSMIEETGAIISEYGLDVPASPQNFPARNRIISGLSDGVLVVEAKRKSGSLITAEFALEEGKQIYAIPGRAYDEQSEGCNNLIKLGAMCVTKPEDILWDLKGEEYMNIDDINKSKERLYGDNISCEDKNCLAPTEKMVYSCLSLEPMYIDDIISKVRIGITKTISVLYTLEEKGLIKQPTKGYYIISL